MKFKQLLKKIGRNLGIGFLGGVIGVLISIIYTLTIWLPINADKIGLGIIAVLPVMILLFSVMGFIVGLILGITVYQIIKLKLKK